MDHSVTNETVANADDDTDLTEVTDVTDVTDEDQDKSSLIDEMLDNAL